MESTRSNSTQDFREFYETVGTNYPEEDLVYQTLRGLIRKQFVLSRLQYFSPPFLDLGCNRGFYVSRYSQGAAIGIDLALSVLHVAKNRYPKASWVQADIQNLSFLRSEAANSILCSEVIEHLPKADRLIEQCFRILRPGGTLLVTTPNYKKIKPEWIPVGVMQEFGVAGVNGNKYFHTAFRPAELQEMAEQAGFKIVESGTIEKEVKYATRLPVVFFHVLRLLNNTTLKSKRFVQLNERFLETSSLNIYKICKAVHLNNLLTRLVKEGVRTYLLARRP